LGGNREINSGEIDRERGSVRSHEFYRTILAATSYLAIRRNDRTICYIEMCKHVKPRKPGA
jgi:hypothetical protein